VTPTPPLAPPAGRGGGIDLSVLSIVSGKTCWVLHVDALLLNIGGNLHDAVSAAAQVGVPGTAWRQANTGGWHHICSS
jgi:exosome complex RNA-binding protein Rrp42 (RNase PH superfamily)